MRLLRRFAIRHLLICRLADLLSAIRLPHLESRAGDLGDAHEVVAGDARDERVVERVDPLAGERACRASCRGRSRRWRRCSRCRSRARRRGRWVAEVAARPTGARGRTITALELVWHQSCRSFSSQRAWMRRRPRRVDAPSACQLRRRCGRRRPGGRSRGISRGRP